MNRRCMNCMNIFTIPVGYEADNNCCPFCGFIENNPPSSANYLPSGIILNGRYSMGTVIGAGGFGITYKAWDNTFDCMVAIKEYFPRGLVSRTETKTVSVYEGEEIDFSHGKERFLKEGRSLAKFNRNPFVVSVQDYFEANGTAYLVMEYLKGRNLKEFLKSTNSTMPFDMAVNMSKVMCDVLIEIHSAGIIHRDISPDNIFLCDDGTYKLIDFGASRINATDSKLSTTVFLKPGYAPIEQYSKNGKIGPWTDVYAFSATIYTLLTGITPQDSIERMDSDTLKPLISINNNIPKNFSDAIQKGLAVQVVDRFQNIEELKALMFNHEAESITEKGTISPPPAKIEPIYEETDISIIKYRRLSRLYAVISMLGAFLFAAFNGIFDKTVIGSILSSIPVIFLVFLFAAFAFFKDEDLRGFEIPLGIGTVAGCTILLAFSVFMPKMLVEQFGISDSLKTVILIVGLIISLFLLIRSLFSVHWAFLRTGRTR